MKLHVLMCLASMMSLLLVAVVRSPGQTPVSKADSNRYILARCVNEFTLDKTEKIPAGYQYWFGDKDLAEGKTLKMSVVGPQSSTHSPHVHSEDELFFVLEARSSSILRASERLSVRMQVCSALRISSTAHATSAQRRQNIWWSRNMKRSRKASARTPLKTLEREVADQPPR